MEILETPYSRNLTDAAESFLIAVFEEGGSPPLGDGPSNTVVAAAMHIVQGAAWLQPTDEQIKASVFCRRNPMRPGSPTSDDPPLHEEPPQ